MEESLLLKLIKRGDALAFSHLFMTYHKDLVLFAGTFQLSQSDCEDIVQTLFLKLWNEREQLTIKTSLTSYLLKAVKNSCLDEIRHQAVVRQHIDYEKSLCAGRSGYGKLYFIFRPVPAFGDRTP